MLKPLTEWFCDTCGGVVTKEGGWFEWLEGPDVKARSFGIVHWGDSKPSGCQYHDRMANVSDVHLEDVIGNNLPALYNFIDPGPGAHPDHNREIRVANISEFMEIVRRLTLPFYEEARVYFDDAREDGYFDDCNEIGVLLPKRLIEIIERYAQAE